MKHQTIIVFLNLYLFTSFPRLYAQAQLGLRLENFAGICGISTNPTAGLHNPLAWDISLVGAGAFLTNDFAFIRNANVSSTLKNIDRIGPAPETNIEFPFTPVKIIDFYNRQREKHLSTAFFLTLPSFQINLKNGQSFGFFWGKRAALSLPNIPIVADPYEQKKILRGDKTPLPPFKGRGMLWQETGVNYARRLGLNFDWGLGVSLKYLQGHQAFFLENLSGTAVTRVTKDSTRVDVLNAKTGFTNNYSTDILAKNGFGFSLDLGLTFTLETGDMDERPYLLRGGISVLDIGSVRFSKNTEVHALNTTESFSMDTKDYLNLDPKNPEADFLRRFNQKTVGKADSSYIGNTFAIGLPTALSFQADFAFIKNVFVNGLLVQRLPMGQNPLLRDNILAVTPRYETRWLTASMPFSLLNYRQFQVGLAARFAFLTIGSDDIASLFGQKRLNGGDFYIALKINAFRPGRFNWGGDRSQSSGGKLARCYQF